MTVNNLVKGARIASLYKETDELIKKAMTAGSTTGTETHNQHLTQEPLKEEDIDGVHKAGEGTHGGTILGHTKSGKPIYADRMHESHNSFTADEHRHAASINQHLSQHSDSKEKSAKMRHMLAQQHHEFQANKRAKEEGVEKSEIISEHDLAIENQLTLLKSIDVTKLQKKEVQVRGKNGQTFFAVRYINPNSGQAEVTGHKSTETEQHKDNPEKQIDTIMNHPSKNKAEKIRDFISLGVYDKKTLMLLSGADYVQAHQAIAKVGVTNLPSTRGAKTEGTSSDGNTAESGKDGGFPPDGMSKKDGDKLLAQARLKRRQESGLTYHDYWNTYKSTLESVMVEGYPKSLIAYGTGGLGKSHDLAEVMKKNKIRVFDAEINPSSDQYDAAVVKGDAGKKSMWATICKNKDKIIIFDDCDTMWTSGDEGQQNVLKGMLDTTGDGVITYGQAGKDENGEQLPKTIKFTGQVIFISNLPRKDFPQPLIDSRCAAIDLTMTKDETMEKIGDIKHLIKHRGKNDVEIPVSKEAKDQAYDFFKEHKDHLGLGQINGRTFAQVSHIAHKHKEAKSAKGAFEKEAKIRMNLV